jgi:hypothetical protein
MAQVVVCLPWVQTPVPLKTDIICLFNCIDVSTHGTKTAGTLAWICAVDQSAQGAFVFLEATYSQFKIDKEKWRKENASFRNVLDEAEELYRLY